MELADTSVWAQRRHPAIRAWFEAAVVTGAIAGCDVIALELLHSARNPDEFARLEEGLRGVPWFDVEAADWRRVREVYRSLGSKPGMPQRSVRLPDLVVAAVAERHRLTLVHYDSDFDTIAAVTGQPTRWAAPRGSL